MTRASRLKERRPSWPGRRFVRMQNLIFAVLAIVAGVLVEELVPVDRDTKNLLAGALLAGGIGVAFAELTTTGDRRRVDELRREGFARCRAAYRLGEFAIPFALAVRCGERASHNVDGMLDASEIVGIRQSIERFSQATDLDPNELQDHVSQLLQFVGDDLVAFFRLGSTVGAIRGEADKISDRQLLATALGQIADTLDAVAPYTGEDQLLEGWLTLCAWWNAQLVSDTEAQALVLLFHAYFLVLGARGRGEPGPAAQRFRDVIGSVAGARRHASATDIASRVASAQAAIAS